MTTTAITEEMIFQCFAAAQQSDDTAKTAESFIDVEEYENRVMYPEFARWAEKAGHPRLATLFRKVAGEEKLHAVWLRELYDEIGVPPRGEDTQRAVDALSAIQANCDALIAMDPGRRSGEGAGGGHLCGGARVSGISTPAFATRRLRRTIPGRPKSTKR